MQLAISARLAIVFAILGTAGSVLAWQTKVRLPESGIVPGLRFDGEAVSESTVNEVVHRHAESLRARTLELRVDGEDGAAAHLTFGELGVHVDEKEIVREALSFGHGSDAVENMGNANRAKNGLIDIPLRVSVDAETVARYLGPLKDRFDTAPASARLDLEKRTVIPERDGRSLDVWGLVRAIDHAAITSLDTITIPQTHFPPRTTREFVAAIDVHVVLGEFETYFSRGGDQIRRGHNIDNGASKLDGVVLSPGEVMSFNDVVGDRSIENGFEKSWEIFKGEMVEGVGGGTCQVASTVHAAAIFAGLDVIERLPHSRPSAYIPMGLDSTVVFPAVDLKLRNTFPFPVVIHAKTDANKLKIQVLGASKPLKVSFSREVEESVPYPRKVEEDERLSGNKVTVKQHGIRGFRIKRTRTLIDRTGVAKRESKTDTYPPTTEIYEIPVGFDESLLPPLPTDSPDENASVATTENDGDKGNGVTFVEAPGAHTPTNAQLDPAKSLTLIR